MMPSILVCLYSYVIRYVDFISMTTYLVMPRLIAIIVANLIIGIYLAYFNDRVIKECSMIPSTKYLLLSICLLPALYLLRPFLDSLSFYNQFYHTVLSYGLVHCILIIGNYIGILFIKYK